MEKKVMQRIFELMKNEVAEMEEFHSEDLPNVYLSPILLG
jgi:hypothetical protein